MSQILIVDTDQFFNDSPNTGEPDCICSRCHRHIKEEEKVLRVPVDRELFTVINKVGEEQEEKVDVVDGFEFRLCTDCLKKL